MVTTCTRCGRESPEDFEFCPACGASLAPPAYERRKTVTVLFCNLTGSTALGERTDPEALRALMGRYYETARVVLEQSAGPGEILLGDDTLRLVRDAVTTEAFELLLKGKTGVVPAHRMLAFDPAAAGVARNLERRLIGHAVSDDLDMVMLVERMRHIEAGVRTALGDVDAARAILEELAASAEERGFVRLAAFYGRELAALGSGGRD